MWKCYNENRDMFLVIQLLFCKLLKKKENNEYP